MSPVNYSGALHVFFYQIKLYFNKYLAHLLTDRPGLCRVWQSTGRADCIKSLDGASCHSWQIPTQQWPCPPPPSPPTPTPPPYSRPCPPSTPRLPLHLSANNLLEPAMPLVHLCLPPQIELFDARRRHATAHEHTRRLYLQTYIMCIYSLVSMHPEGQAKVVSWRTLSSY